jgi:hypothetical protein
MYELFAHPYYLNRCTKDKFFQFNLTNFKMLDYHKDLCSMTNLPVDDENTIPIWNAFAAKIKELNEQGEFCTFKQVDYEKLFEGMTCNLTSDTF